MSTVPVPLSPPRIEALAIDALDYSAAMLEAICGRDIGELILIVSSCVVFVAHHGECLDELWNVAIRDRYYTSDVSCNFDWNV
jgi:hypothetical protein